MTENKSDIKDLQKGKSKQLVKGKIAPDNQAIQQQFTTDQANQKSAYTLGANLGIVAARYDNGVQQANIQVNQHNLNTQDLKNRLILFDGTQVSQKVGQGQCGNYFATKQGSDIVPNNSWGHNVSLIYLSYGTRGSVGVRIPLASVQKDKPIIVTTGQLNGCITTYSVDDQNFYAIHTGRNSDDNIQGNWSTNDQGIDTTNAVYEALKTNNFGQFQNFNMNNRQSRNYNDLRQIYQNNTYRDTTFITYSGSKTVINNNIPNSYESLNYSTANGHVAFSYALLAQLKSTGDVSSVEVKVRSTELIPNLSNYEGKYKTVKNEKFVLKKAK